MFAVMQAHRVMPNRFRSLIEKWLPWYDPDREHRADVGTERIRVKSVAARIFAEKVERALAEYREANRR